MDIGTSFGYVFQDPDWVKKVAIGGGILLVGILFSWLLGIPIIIAVILLLGYQVTVIKNVADGLTTPLPEWSDLGGLFMKGLYAAIGAFVLFLPIIVLGICSALFSALLAGGASSSTSSSNGAASIAALVSTCLSCIMSIYGLVVGLYLYAPLTRYALNNQMNTFWDFRGNWAFISANMGNYIVAVIMAFVASFVGSLGAIACFIGLPFTEFYAQLVVAHVLGQLARGSAAPVAPAPYAPPPATV